MKLPIDVKAVIDEATSIEEARQVPLSVCVLIDDTAPSDVIAHVRSLFASAATHVRITMSYLGAANYVPSPDDSMAVIVAGFDKRVGECAATIRTAGVPVLVVTTLPEQVRVLAHESGFAIPEGDLVAPALTEDQRSLAREAFERVYGEVSARMSALPAGEAEQEAEAEYEPAETAPANEEPVVAAELVQQGAAKVHTGLRDAIRGFDLGKFLKKTTEAEPKEEPAMPQLLSEESTRALDMRMGEWIIEACRDKRLSFSLAFPFVARPLSLEAVNATAVQNAGVGLVVILPGADMPIMTLNQAKMLLQIAAAYGQEMTVERLKELAAVVGGAFMFRSIARNVVAIVPAGGWIVKGAIGYTGTIAMGRAAIEYFENGAGLSGVTGTLLRVKDGVLKAVASISSRKEADEGAPAAAADSAKDTMRAVGQKVAAAAEVARVAAGPLAQKAAQGAMDSFVSGVKTMIK